MKRVVSLILVLAFLAGSVSTIAQAAEMPRSQVTIENSTVTTLSPEQSIRLAALQAVAQEARESVIPTNAEGPKDDAGESGGATMPQTPPMEDADEGPLPEPPEIIAPEVSDPVEDEREPDPGEPQPDAPPAEGADEAPAAEDAPAGEQEHPLQTAAPMLIEIAPMAAPITTIANGATHDITTAGLALTGGGTFTVTGGSEETPAANAISLSNGTYEVTLQNAWVDCTAVGGTAAISLENAELTLILVGVSTLIGAESRAGIRVPENSSIIIKNGNSGSVTARGGDSSQGEGASAGDAGAGIGGNIGESNGPITIESGTVNAYAGSYVYNGAAGIGGGSKGGDGNNITITGGLVAAAGSKECYYAGAGIGGGSNGSASGILIAGASTNQNVNVVNATASEDTNAGAAGIGGGYKGAASNITIEGNVVNAKSSPKTGNNGAGIGGGYDGDASCILITGGIINVTSDVAEDGVNGAGIGGGGNGGGHNIRITGGTVTVRGNSRGAGIGGGCNGDGTDIYITGTGNVYATGGSSPLQQSYYGGAGIGGGFKGNGIDITIEDQRGNIQATSGHGGAGIGGGSCGYAKNIYILNSTYVYANTVNSNYSSDLSGAAIGGGYGFDGISPGSYHNTDNDTGRGAAINIVIDQSTVYAYSYYAGAGIGSGAFCKGTRDPDVSIVDKIPSNAKSVANIRITNSTITATGGSGATIGSGAYNLTSNTSTPNVYLLTDIYIDNCTLTLNNSSGAGIGGGYYNWYNITTVEVSNCARIQTGNYSSGAGIGSGQQNNYSQTAVNISNCTTLNLSTGHGAGIGSGGSCQYGTVTATVSDCGEILLSCASNSNHNGSGIGSGGNNSYNAVDITVENCGPITINNSTGYKTGIGSGGNNSNNAVNVTIQDCGEIKITNSVNNSNYLGGTGIGSGFSNSANNVNVTLERCGAITIANSNQYATGVGSGYNNSNNAVEVSILDAGAVAVTNNTNYGAGIGSGANNSGATQRVAVTLAECESITLTMSHMNTGIGTGPFNSGNSRTDVTVTNCGAIVITGTSSYVTGIGSGHNNSSNTAYVSLRDCDSLTINTNSSYFTGIGCGPSSSANSQAYIAIVECGTIAISSSGTSVGVGSGPNGSSNVLEVAIESCNNIIITNNANASVGIGAGYYNAGTTQSVKITIKDSGAISITNSNTYSTGIGTAYNNYNGNNVNITIENVTSIDVASGSANGYAYNVGIGSGFKDANSNAGGNAAITLTNCGDISVDLKKGERCTAIGSGKNQRSGRLDIIIQDCGNITTNATGSYSVGIGAGRLNNTAYATCIKLLDCGDVSANCGLEGVAIGGGDTGSDHLVDVLIQNCGIILADGSAGGTGIGSGANCYANTGKAATITIALENCNTITAIGSGDAAGIGTGSECRNNAETTVIITDCVSVTATGGSQAPGIGAGYYNRNGSISNVTIINCRVDSRSSGSSGMGCGDQNSNNSVELLLANCIVTAIGVNGAGIGSGATCSNYATVDAWFTDCDITASSEMYGAGVGNGLRNSLCTNTFIIDGGTLTATGMGGGAGIGCGPAGIACVNDIIIKNDADVTATGSGATSSVLADGGEPLGSDAGAGIGGTRGQNGGVVSIESGTVTAIGGSLSGYCAAGIGGGYMGTGGHIIISGGAVTATAGQCPDCGAAGIGGGVEGNGGTIEIHGGHVTARGSNGTRTGGAGIGGGQDGNGGTITITGGTVNAIASERGAGIGGGSNGQGGSVAISGGKITVLGGLYDTAGIGGGTNMSPGVGNDSTPLGGTLTLSGSPELVVYGKSSNLAITAEVSTSAPLVQATMLNFSSAARHIELENQSDGGIVGIDLPGEYMAFSATLLGNEGDSYFAWLHDDETYRLATTPDKVDVFVPQGTLPVIARNLNIIKYFDVVFDTGADGSAIPVQSVRIGDSVTVPDEVPTRLGYQFAGWFEDEACTRSFDFTTAIERDTTVYANWIEGEGVVYTVEHYKQELDGGYILANTEYFLAPHDTVVSANYLSYTGFHSATDHPDRVTSGLLYEGEALTLKLYYDRNILKLTIENIENGSQIVEGMYGSMVILQSPSKTGYDFDSWMKEDGSAVPDYPVPIEQLVPTIYAQWVLRDGVPYKVNHYLRNLAGSYVLKLSEDFAGVFGTEVEAVARSYEGFHLNTSISEQTGKGIVDPEGYLILRMFYDRDTVTVNLSDEYNDPATISGDYGAIVNLPQRGKAGYIFDGWFKGDGSPVGDEDTVETLGETVYARWTANASVQYTVRHYQQNLADDGYTIYETEDLYGATDSTVSVTAKHYSGYHLSITATQTMSGVVSAENMLLLSLYYDRNLYTVSYAANGGSTVSNQTGIKYKGRADEPAPPMRLGYDFAGWLTQDGNAYNFMAEVTDNLALTAKWTARHDTDYRVQHYQQNITDNNYTLVDVEYLQGVTDATASAVVRSYTGFELHSEISVLADKVLPNGTTILKVYYDRLEYTVTYADRGETTEEHNDVRHGAFAPAPDTLIRSGYNFVAWCVDEELTTAWSFATGVVTAPMILYAKWEPRLDVDYVVRHYQQDVMGSGYTLVDTDNLSGQADTTVTAAAKDYAGFYEHTTHANRTAEGNLEPDGSLVLVLYYDRNTFDVTFDSKGGSAVAAQNGIRYDGTVAEPSNPARTGYTFMGWQLGGVSYGFSTPVTDNFTLDAAWEANTYTITYNYQGATSGNGTATKTVTYDAAYGTLPAPYRTGYNFAGWFNAQVGGAEVKADTMVKITGPQTLYARWTQGDGTIYKVQHFLQDVEGEGYALHATDVLYGVTESEAFAGTHPYAGFHHNADHPNRVHSGIIASDGGLVLSVYYDRDTFTASFDSTGGTAAEAQTLRYQAAVVKPADPSKLGYTFSCWMLGETPYIFASEVTDNITLTAAWTANTDTPYAVEHYRQDLIGSAYTRFETDELAGTTGLVVSAIPHTYEGFVVNATHPDRITSGTVLRDGSQVLRIYYDRQLYTVSFNSGGGGQVATQSGIRYEGRAVQPESPTKTGFVFAGWYADAGLTEEWTFDTPVCGNMTLYAKWDVQTGIAYTVRHHRQNTVRTGYDLAVTETLYAENGAEVTATPRTYTGFHVNMELGMPSGIMEAEVPLELSLYYDRNIYTIAFDSTGGTAVESISVAFGATYGPLPTPTKAGSTFVSWHTAGGMEIKATTPVDDSGDTTLYAQWHTLPATPPSIGGGGVAPAPAPEPKPVHDCPSLAYRDLDVTKWYHPYTDYVLDNNLMVGTALGLFSPDLHLTRAQAAMILARITDTTPELPEKSPFSDVPLGHWAAAAIIWADASALMIGYGDGHFGPDDILTREQFAVIVFRVSGDQAAATNALDRYSDKGNVSPWAADALTWAVNRALLLGDDAQMLRPRDGITRVETATILERWLATDERR